MGNFSVMPDNELLDFNIIASDCLIATNSDSVDIIARLERLKYTYSDIELIAIFNYFLKIEYSSDVLCWLVRNLDKYRDSSSLEQLTKLLLMKDYTPNAAYTKADYVNLRVLCAKAISNLKDHSAVHSLLECLNDKHEDYKVRLSCADALGRLGDKYAVTSLMDVVSDNEEKSVYIRESAAIALGLIGDMRAVDSLVKVLETQNGIMNKFSYLKEKAIEALCRLSPNNDRAFNALKKSLMDENSQVRINAIEALMNYDNDEAYSLIKKMLMDEDDEVKSNAVVALYNIAGEPVLHEILDSSSFSDVCKAEARTILEDEFENGD